MSGTRVGLGRMVALGVCLALALLLLGARAANAAKYNVAQCGWYVDRDAGWADSTGGVKFRPDAWCVPPPGADPFNGVHLKSFTRNNQTSVSGTRFARWRWEAPPGTAISRVAGTWWQALHDGMQQRIGVGTWAGGFHVLGISAATNTALRNFAYGVDPPQPALEDRLLCAKAESNWCSLASTSWSGLRALTITVEDNHAPGAAIGGDLLAGGWRKGVQSVAFSGGDTGGGVRYGETRIDGARVHLAEYPCAMTMISGEWRGTRMAPCLSAVSGGAAVDTRHFSDGPHTVRHCSIDFAGNTGCSADRAVAIDNNPPAHPRNLALAGGDGWRRVNDFDLAWQNPGQGQASPIWGAYWRIVGPGGHDTGTVLAPGRDIAALANRTVPVAGVYSLQLWLRDEAGNHDPSSAVSVPLRLDDVRPGLAFEPTPDAAPGPDLPEVVRAEIHDAHSGPAGGQISYRRVNGEGWIELPTKRGAGDGAGRAQLTARLPEGLPAGTYVFRAEAADVAGNITVSTRRADGTEMALRKVVGPGEAAKGSAQGAGAVTRARTQGRTRLFAHLRWRKRRGPGVTVPFGAGAALGGRLVTADGAGLAGRRLRVVSRPSRGALTRRTVDTVRTGRRGGFRLALRGGPSRRITVSFAGESGLAGSRRPALALRVRGGLVLHAAPAKLHTGQAVRLWGRVRTRGAPLPRRGKLVAIQYYESAARRWRPVMVVRSNHGGRFSASYRFRYVSGKARIRLRAVALAEERWPYAPGASRPVAVRVTG